LLSQEEFNLSTLQIIMSIKSIVRIKSKKRLTIQSHTQQYCLGKQIILRN
jgi:hypothetical protein